MNPLIQLKQTNSVFLITLLLACFGLSSAAQAVVPAPDGGYPGANTAEGQNALLNRTTGIDNTAVGYLSLKIDTTGSYNTAIGAGALLANTADENTATGFSALYSNAVGNRNTADGTLALFKNTIGTGNTATGWKALFGNTTGAGNTATGYAALGFNTTGITNTANGSYALAGNTTGNRNTADGWGALNSNTTGSNNTALGCLAGTYLSIGNNNIDIGYNVTGVLGESNTIRIGNANITDTLISGIYNQHLAVGLPVYIQPNGTLFTPGSSKRFKQEIKAMDKASETLFALKPVTFRYKKAIDPVGTTQFGLVAEDVEKVNPDLVVHDENGKVNSVRYDQVNAMFLNEFLKEHSTVQELKSNAAKQETTIAQQQKEIDALKAGLQKVSVQLEASKAAPQVAVNKP